MIPHERAAAFTAIRLFNLGNSTRQQADCPICGTTLDVGHEAHFAELLDELLGWIDTGRRSAALAEWTLAKYTFLAEAAAATAHAAAGR